MGLQLYLLLPGGQMCGQVPETTDVNDSEEAPSRHPTALRSRNLARKELARQGNKAP